MAFWVHVFLGARYIALGAFDEQEGGDERLAGFVVAEATPIGDTRVGGSVA
jgi:hypothetical protein